MDQDTRADQESLRQKEVLQEGLRRDALRLAIPEPPRMGKFLFRWLPIRRGVILENLRLALGSRLSEDEIRRLAQCFYGHLARVIAECLRVPRLTSEERRHLVRVENPEAVYRARSLGKGVLFLSGHFGNFEVVPVLALEQYPDYRGKVHILRRPIRFRPVERFLLRCFERAGIGVIPKTGSLGHIRARLAAGDVVVFVLDQYASRKDGVPTRFFGHPVSTFRSLAVVAMSTGAPVVPTRVWREPDGRHVLRFEEALVTIEAGSIHDSVVANTDAYNEVLERFVLEHPEQWFWFHRRWKRPRGRR